MKRRQFQRSSLVCSLGWPLRSISVESPENQIFAKIEHRPKWAITWLEDVPNLLGVQLWAGRMLRDAVDAHRYGCEGLMGIHWRRSILAPNRSLRWREDDQTLLDAISAAIAHPSDTVAPGKKALAQLTRTNAKINSQ